MKRINNPSTKPQGSEASAVSMSPDPIADLLAEISTDPEMKSTPARRRAEARLEDYNLIEQVRYELAAGDQHKNSRQSYYQLFDDLWLYAWPVLQAFIRTHKMSQVLARYVPDRTVSIRPEDMWVLSHSGDERMELAIDVIESAWRAFEKAAIRGKHWSPTGGASLRTWFIGTCALNFPRAYRTWSKKRSDRLVDIARQHEIDFDSLGGRLAEGLGDPSGLAILRRDLKKLVDQAQPDTKVILGLLLQEKTQAQIAAELGLTVRAVEGRIYRWRKRARGNDPRVNPGDRHADLFDVQDPWALDGAA